MTAAVGIPLPATRRPRATDARRWLQPGLILGGLAVVVAARWWATRSGVDPLMVGGAFGLALLGVAAARRGSAAATSEVSPRGLRRFAANILLGSAAGVTLVTIVVAGPLIANRSLVPGLLQPAAAWLPWALITIVVAGAEEAVLRGRLFSVIRRSAGTPVAIGITTVAFALMHVPLYGWHVVPLDVAVGLAFAGLRIASGGVVAPAAAH